MILQSTLQYSNYSAIVKPGHGKAAGEIRETGTGDNQRQRPCGEVVHVCDSSAQAPGNLAQALAMAGAALDFLNSPAAADLPGSASGEVLAALGELHSKLTAARAGFLRRFDAADGHDGDGYGSSSAWLAAKTGMTPKAAKAAVRQMRQLSAHQPLHDALAAATLTESLAAEVAAWTSKLPN